MLSLSFIILFYILSYLLCLTESFQSTSLPQNPPSFFITRESSRRKHHNKQTTTNNNNNMSESFTTNNNTSDDTSPSSSSESESESESESDPLTFLSDVCGQLKKLKRTGWVRHNIPFPESDADHMHRCAMCAMILTQAPNPLDDYTDSDDDELNNNNNTKKSRFHPSRISPNHILKMALVHDLCEALAGDITPFCDPKLVQSKHEKERVSMEEIRRIIGDPLGKELYDLWQEYESQETAEAIYCKDIDKFEMVMQAYEYEKDHLMEKKNKNKNNENDGNSDEMKEEKKANNNLDNEKVLNEPMRTFFITTNNVMKTPIFRRLDKGIREKRELMLKSKGWEVSSEERQLYGDF